MTDEPRPGGVFAPVLTPFSSDLSPDPERLVNHCRWVLSDGCHGLVLFGTTSEANSLALDERIDLLEAVVAAGIAPEKLIVGTGTCAIPETVRLTRHALDLGCSAVLMLPPFYYKAVSEDGLYGAYAETIERVGDARLRVYLYHIPQVSGVAVTLPLTERLLSFYGGIVVGIKDSSGDWLNTQALLRNFPGFRVFAGSEETLLATLRGGGAGCITATANINAAAVRWLYDNWETPQAEALQERVTEVRRAAQSQPMIPGLKRVVAWHRKDEGWFTVRPPLVELSEVEAANLFADLQGAGFSMSPV